MAMQLLGEIQKETGVSVGMGELLRDGSIAGVVELVKQQVETDGKLEWRERTKKAVSEDTTSRSSEEIEIVHTLFVPMTESQAGLYSIWKMDPGATNYSVNVLISGLKEGKQIIQDSVQTVIKLHSALRTRRFHMSGKVALQELSLIHI